MDDEPSKPAVNGGQTLSGLLVQVASRNACHMTEQGYEWSVYGSYGGCPGGEQEPEAGTVFTPEGAAYAIWLPGMLHAFPEGRCECPFFLQNAICKHLFFATWENDKAIDQAYAGWEPNG